VKNLFSIALILISMFQIGIANLRIFTFSKSECRNN